MAREIFKKQLKYYTSKIMRIVNKHAGLNACVLFTKGTEDGLEVIGSYSIANPYYDDDTHKAIVDSWKDWLERDSVFEKELKGE